VSISIDVEPVGAVRLEHELIGAHRPHRHRPVRRQVDAVVAVTFNVEYGIALPDPRAGSGSEPIEADVTVKHRWRKRQVLVAQPRTTGDARGVEALLLRCGRHSGSEEPRPVSTGYLPSPGVNENFIGGASRSISPYSVWRVIVSGGQIGRPVV
jgi:hypothetical protein